MTEPDQAPKRGNLKRVAGNTLFMYSRTVFSLALNLFATRLVLKTLGVEDFGLFAVLASIIASFSFITGAVNGSVSRFLCAALGHEDRREFSAIFTASAVLLFGVALLIAALTELCGLWYIQNHLVVAPERLSAAMTAFHFCVASTVILIIALPYQAALISQENIRAFALFTVCTDVLKFLAVIALTLMPGDKLELYALLLMLAQITPQMILMLYARHTYPDCALRLPPDRSRLREIGQYACWDLLGCLTVVAQSQGLNILVNAFFGLVFNAAYGIAMQVNGAISQFVYNFVMASNPQIMKLYHSGAHEEMKRMMRLSSYLAGFLLLFFAVPLFIEVEFVLSVWLGEYPAHAPVFIRIFLVQSLVMAMSRPIVAAVHAIGLVRIHNLASSSVVISILPVSYVLLKLGVPLPVVFVINIIPWVLECVVDSFIIRRAISFSVSRFFLHTYLRILAYGCLLLAIPAAVTLWMPQDGFLRFLIVGTISVITFCAVVYFLVMNDAGRQMARDAVRTKIIARIASR